MANKSLTDLTALTATADSDLLHINSGGTDYKESKSNFLCGDFNHVFANNTLLTTQADALPSKPGVYHGYCAASGHQTELGIPINSAIYITVKFWVANYGEIDIQDVTNPENAHYVLKKVSGTWDSTWTRIPARSEITSLNNSLTQCLTTTPGIITSGKDLNDYKSNGLYIIQSGVTNSPSSWCALLVIGTPTTYGVHQIAFSFSAFYVRSYTGSPMSWTNWRSLTFS